MPKDFLYLNIIGLARVVTAAQGVKVNMTGLENVPPTGGAVVVMNHSGYLDFVYAGYPFRKYRRYVRYMAKSDVFENPVAGPLMRGMKHIPVDRIDGTQAFDTAVEMLKDGELVGIFPEATVSRSFEIKNLRTGAVRLAQAAGVPIIMVMMVGSQRIWTKNHKKHLIHPGTPIQITVFPEWYPTGDVAEATDELRTRMQEGLEETWDEYEQEFGIEEGAYWVPARRGGSAPTLEESQKIDLEIEAERHRVRTLTEEISQLAEKISQASRRAQARGALAVDVARQRIEQALKKNEEAEENVVSDVDVPAVEADTIEEHADAQHKFKASIDELVEEVGKTAKEGKERIAEATEQLRRSVSDFYVAGADKLADSALESALVQFTAQTRVLLDKLPQRKNALKRGLPATLVLSLDGALVAADSEEIPEASVEFFTQLGQDGKQIILTSVLDEERATAIARQMHTPVQVIARAGAVTLNLSAEGEVLERTTVQIPTDVRARVDELVAVDDAVSVEWIDGDYGIIRIIEDAQFLERLEQTVTPESKESESEDPEGTEDAGESEDLLTQLCSTAKIISLPHAVVDEDHVLESEYLVVAPHAGVSAAVSRAMTGEWEDVAALGATTADEVVLEKASFAAAEVNSPVSVLKVVDHWFEKPADNGAAKCLQRSFYTPELG